jgi:hypothetical protein
LGGLKDRNMPNDTQALTTTETAQNGTKPASGKAPIVQATQGADAPDRALSAFASEANFTTGQRIAKALAASSLVPDAYRGNIPNVLIAMELANRIGASVFAVMQNIDVIHGRPSWRASFLIATVNASGRFSPLRFRWQGKEGTDSWGCRAVAKDRESGEECVGSLITIGMAKAEGWATKNGSKWKTLPEQMLCYRAAAFWTRIYAPELSLGMQTTDEQDDRFGAGDPGELPIAITPGDPKALEQVLLGNEPDKPPTKIFDPAGEVTPPENAGDAWEP